MRVISGYLGGRNFESPHGHRTHPMSEKIRGAIFNALGDIEGLSVFDPFTGSGALSFEAVSRGAARATAIDNDKSAYNIAKKNILSLGIDDKVHVTHAFNGSWSTRHKVELFDLVLLDPPYDLYEVEEVEKLAQHTKKGGIAVFSLPNKARLILDPKKFDLLNSKSYGDATLSFYRRVA